MKTKTQNKTCREICRQSLSIEVTTRCNSECTYCFARAGISRNSSLSIDLVKDIISEGFDLSFRHLHITGGEPFLWEGLIDVLEYAFVLGYESVFLNTNGMLLTKGLAKRLRSFDDLSLSISLQVNRGTHDNMRGRGSYALALKGIDLSLESGLKLLIFTTVCKSVLSELPEYTYDIFQRFPDIQHISLIQLIRVANDVFDLSKELLEPEDFLELVQMVSLFNLCGLRTDILNNPLAGVTSYLLGLPWMSRSRPLHDLGNIFIMANGDISSSHSSRNPFGKYQKGMIQKILSSNMYRRAMSPNVSTCSLCPYVGLCRDGGMDWPSESFRDMHSDTPYCKRVLDLASEQCLLQFRCPPLKRVGRNLNTQRGAEVGCPA
jgi:MoaA/NifB/PqqE/SkfB family radical SAM enzyme